MWWCVLNLTKWLCVVYCDFNIFLHSHSLFVRTRVSHWQLISYQLHGWYNLCGTNQIVNQILYMDAMCCDYVYYLMQCSPRWTLNSFWNSWLRRSLCLCSLLCVPTVLYLTWYTRISWLFIRVHTGLLINGWMDIHCPALLTLLCKSDQA
jgi:hypothetical protein